MCIRSCKKNFSLSLLNEIKGRKGEKKRFSFFLGGGEIREHAKMDLAQRVCLIASNLFQADQRRCNFCKTIGKRTTHALHNINKRLDFYLFQVQLTRNTLTLSSQTSPVRKLPQRALPSECLESSSAASVREGSAHLVIKEFDYTIEVTPEFLNNFLPALWECWLYCTYIRTQG